MLVLDEQEDRFAPAERLEQLQIADEHGLAPPLRRDLSGAGRLEADREGDRVSDVGTARSMLDRPALNEGLSIAGRHFIQSRQSAKILGDRMKGEGAEPVPAMPFEARERLVGEAFEEGARQAGLSHPRLAGDEDRLPHIPSGHRPMGLKALSSALRPTRLRRQGGRAWALLATSMTDSSGTKARVAAHGIQCRTVHPTANMPSHERRVVSAAGPGRDPLRARATTPHRPSRRAPPRPRHAGVSAGPVRSPGRSRRHAAAHDAELVAQLQRRMAGAGGVLLVRNRKAEQHGRFGLEWWMMRPPLVAAMSITAAPSVSEASRRSSRSAGVSRPLRTQARIVTCRRSTSRSVRAADRVRRQGLRPMRVRQFGFS